MMDPQIVYFGSPGCKIESVQIKEGDTLVLSGPWILTEDDAQVVKAKAESVVHSLGFTNVGVVVLSQSCTMTVLAGKAA